MTTDLNALAARVAALEADKERARKAARFWARLTPKQRRARYAERTGSTTGDNLRYPSDYNDPADSPAAFQTLAEDTQVALNKRTQTWVTNYQTHLSYPFQHSSWNTYTTVTSVETYQRLGNWAAMPGRSALPGVWRVTCMSYCDVTGGTSSDQGIGVGIVGAWTDASAFDWAGMGQATIGRITAPKATRIVVAQVSVGYVINKSNTGVRFAPSATLYGSHVTGSVTKVGESRMTVEWLSSISQITGITYPA